MMIVLRGILLVLKWIGILLLIILGLILLVLLLALLAPVRYKGKGKKQEVPEDTISADGLVSWLNPLIRIRIRFSEKKLRYTVRLLGICLHDSEKPKKEKKPKRQRRQKRRRRQRKQKKALKKRLRQVLRLRRRENCLHRRARSGWSSRRHQKTNSRSLTWCRG